MVKSRKALAGKEFGRIVVLERADDYRLSSGNAYPQWKCRCKCGKEIVVRQQNLREGGTSSCGCLIKDMNHERLFTGHQQLSGDYVSHVRKSAGKRQIAYDVETQYLYELFVNQGRICALSGVELTLNPSWENGRQDASIDRIDSGEGYVEGNVRWTHKVANRMRGELDDATFIDWCRQVYSHHYTKKWMVDRGLVCNHRELSPASHLLNDYHPRFTGYGRVSGKYIRSLITSSTTRNLSFNLEAVSLNELFEFQDGRCALTDAPISLNQHLSRDGATSQTASLDRIDSDVGYEIENVRWVHKLINNMKSKMSDEQFVGWCSLIYLHSIAQTDPSNPPASPSDEYY